MRAEMPRRWRVPGLALAVLAGLWFAAAGLPAGAGDDPTSPAAGDTWAGRAAAIAEQAYTVLRDQIIEPARQAGAAALGSPTVEAGYRQFDAMLRSLVATIDEQALQPLGQAASDALNSSTAQQAYDFAGTFWDKVKAGVRRYVVDPLSDLIAPGGDPVAPSDTVPAALTQPQAATPEVPGDPFEPVNRWIFAFNGMLRTQLFQPIVGGYRGLTPPAIQQGLQNFFSNLREPITIVSSLLEGDVDDAGNSAARFGINTTLGILGLNDPATAYGFPRRIHNLEEALCVYRLPSGPYVVLPLYGPATVRDAVGRLATVVAYFEAMGFGIYVPYRLGDAVAQAGTGAASRPGDAPAGDPYLTQKEAYFDAREAGCARYVRNGTDKLGP